MKNIRDFGAVGSGLTPDTAAIQAALDGGGTVLFPPGRYLTGTLHLRSGNELILEKGAEIVASGSPSDYNADDFDPRNQVFSQEHVSGAHLLTAMDCRHIVLRGEGCIQGCGHQFFDLNDLNQTSAYRPFYQWPKWRPAQMLYFCGSSDIEIQGLRLENPPYWCCFLHNCEDIRIHDLTIRADRKMINTDGIDIDCCRRVEIWNCDINCGDDGVAIRGNAVPFGDQDVPCSQVEVHHCRLCGPACGVRIGVGNGIIRNCRLHDLDIYDTGIGIGICPSYSHRKCVLIEDITIADTKFTGRQPICMVPSWGYILPDPTRQPVRNIAFERFQGEGNQGSLLIGIRENRLFDNIALRDVSLTLTAPPVAPHAYHWPYSRFAVLNAAELPNLQLENFHGHSPDPQYSDYIYARDYTPVPPPRA